MPYGLSLTKPPAMRTDMSAARHLFRLCREALVKARNPHLSALFSVPSHLTIHERLALYRLAGGATAIAEIGAYIGASACCFGAALLRSGAGRVICIDTWNNDAMTEGRRDTWQEFLDNTRRFSAFIVPVRGFSTEVIEQVANLTSEIDLLFIDGDHSYDGVKADWECYKALLRAGSTVIFHDYGWAEGVKRVVHDDVRPLVRWEDRLPNMWWCQLGQRP